MHFLWSPNHQQSPVRFLVSNGVSTSSICSGNCPACVGVGIQPCCEEEHKSNQRRVCQRWRDEGEGGGEARDHSSLLADPQFFCPNDFSQFGFLEFQSHNNTKGKSEENPAAKKRKTEWQTALKKMNGDTSFVKVGFANSYSVKMFWVLVFIICSYIVGQLCPARTSWPICLSSWSRRWLVLHPVQHIQWILCCRLSQTRSLPRLPCPSWKCFWKRPWRCITKRCSVLPRQNLSQVLNKLCWCKIWSVHCSSVLQCFSLCPKTLQTHCHLRMFQELLVEGMTNTWLQQLLCHRSWCANQMICLAWRTGSHAPSVSFSTGHGSTVNRWTWMWQIPVLQLEKVVKKTLSLSLLSRKDSQGCSMVLNQLYIFLLSLCVSFCLFGGLLLSIIYLPQCFIISWDDIWWFILVNI